MQCRKCGSELIHFEVWKGVWGWGCVNKDCSINIRFRKESDYAMPSLQRKHGDMDKE